jgi:hypothetical protein
MRWLNYLTWWGRKPGQPRVAVERPKLEWPTPEQIRRAFPSHPDFGKVIKMVPVQYTICDDCGGTDLEHDKAVWTEDGASYCPSCRPELAAIKARMEAKL